MPVHMIYYLYVNTCIYTNTIFGINFLNVSIISEFSIENLQNVSYYISELDTRWCWWQNCIEKHSHKFLYQNFNNLVVEIPGLPDLIGTFQCSGEAGALWQADRVILDIKMFFFVHADKSLGACWKTDRGA